jgi:hypothetical protein
LSKDPGYEGFAVVVIDEQGNKVAHVPIDDAEAAELARHPHARELP